MFVCLCFFVWSRGKWKSGWGPPRTSVIRGLRESRGGRRTGFATLPDFVGKDVVHRLGAGEEGRVVILGLDFSCLVLAFLGG